MARRTDLAARLAGLETAARAAEGRVDPQVSRQALDVVERAGRRLAVAGDHTVVALAGATGSGKSSTFNAVVGAPLAEPGVRRPTTSRATAACWSQQPPTDLLDWLDVPRRHVVGSDRDRLEGLVLLDLPDHDSTEMAHRLEVDRLVELVDMFIWVVDPQKYADAALHDRYLRPMAGHAEVMTVVLNQADRLTPDQRRRCLADLRRLLDSEGLGKAEVVAASATTGEGIDKLTSLLARAVRSRKAATTRLGADVTAAGRALAAEVGPATSAQVGGQATDRLARALALAAGVEAVTEAVGAAARRRGRLATGWPAVSWLAKLRPDPLRRLHLDLPQRASGSRGQGRRAAGEVEPSRVQRTALPARAGVSRARVDTAVRALSDEASRGLPRGWAEAVRSASLEHSRSLPDEIDRAVATTNLAMTAGTGWWRVVTVVQWLLVSAVVVGLGWLGVDLLLVYLQMPRLPAPRWHGFGLPTLLVVGGVVAGIVVSLVSRVGVEVGARAKAYRAERVLTDSVREVARQAVVAPVEEELARHRRAVKALESVL